MSNSDPNPDSSNDRFVRTAQIIAAALVMGCSFFLLVGVFVRATGKNGLLAANPWNVLPPEGLISLIALFVSAGVLAASFVVPNAIATAARQAKGKTPPEDAALGRFDGIFLNQMIVGMALLEGGAFFNGIAFLLEGRIPNILAALVLIALIVAKFPTRAAMDSFAESQEALLFEERQSA
jgi:hypothetical protein